MLEGSRSKLKERKNVMSKNLIIGPSSQVFLSLPSQVKELGPLRVLPHPTTGLHCDPAVLLLRPWKQAGFAANFRKSFLKQMYTWQKITWDKWLSRESQPFYPRTPSHRAKVKTWDNFYWEPWYSSAQTRPKGSAKIRFTSTPVTILVTSFPRKQALNTGACLLRDFMFQPLSSPAQTA